MTLFKTKLLNKTFPEKVLLQIQRARDQHIKKAAFKEPTSEAKSYDYSTFTEIDGSKDNDEAINIASTLPVSDDMQDFSFDRGLDYNWELPRYPLPDQNNNILDTWIQEMVDNFDRQKKNQTQTNLPLKNDGSEYKLVDATPDQSQVLHYIIDHLRLWFDANETNKPPPLRLMISGVAGSGKSTLTNTIVTVIRKMFQSTKAVKVVAPTGQAAYNAGGTTCHHGLGVGVNRTMHEGISSAKEKELLIDNNGLVMLVFDERGMISCRLLARSHYNMCHTAYGGVNKNKSWGNIPIVLCLGDDYQLPSVEPGAPSIYDNDITKTEEDYMGARLFLELAQKVVSLQNSKRQHGSQTRFMRILQGLRCENPQVSSA